MAIFKQDDKGSFWRLWMDPLKERMPIWQSIVGNSGMITIEELAGQVSLFKAEDFEYEKVPEGRRIGQTLRDGAVPLSPFQKEAVLKMLSIELSRFEPYQRGQVSERATPSPG